jgi:Cdc6-like AAA superfamily ATPase
MVRHTKRRSDYVHQAIEEIVRQLKETALSLISEEKKKICMKINRISTILGQDLITHGQVFQEVQNLIYLVTLIDTTKEIIAEIQLRIATCNTVMI